MSNLVMYRQLIYYLVLQPTDDVAYKLFDLVKCIVLHKPALTFFEQHYIISSKDDVLTCNV